MLKRTLLLLCIAAAALPATAADRPDLVVVISIDQFRYDYLTRFEPYFGPDGFRRFLDHGADFTNAMYPYSDTVTGAGHAAIGTGDTPSRSGVIGDEWFDRLSGKPEYCYADPIAGVSPVNLQTEALGDRDQEAYPGAKVFGAAIKDRAAIPMAGRKATGAYWFDYAKGIFTTSSYYVADAKLLSDYNATLASYLAGHPEWDQSGFIPAADLAKITHDPPALRKFKTDASGLGVSFPHPIHSFNALIDTPFGNGLTLGFAEQLIEDEHLGAADGTPDLLFIGLSSQDYIGHFYGPDSLEVADNVVRTDRDLASLFAFLDAHFADRYTVVLTADHGVQSIPEVARDMGRAAGRVSMRNPGKSMRTFGDLKTIAPARVEIEKKVAAALGHPITDRSPLSDGMILDFEEAVYLNWTRIHALKLDGERVKRAIRDAAKKIPGVSDAFTNSELLAAPNHPSAIETAVRRSFRADRSGDVIITLKPGFIWNYNGTGTTHGQPVPDDQHVPLLFWGRGIKPGHYDGQAAPTDIASSVGALLGFRAGASDDVVLPCITRQ